MTAVNGQAYTYDVNGNLINNGAKTFVYNEVNQLTQVKDSSGNVIASYTYDDQGRRTSLTAWGETSKYYYSGDKVIYTTNGSNKVIAEFTYDPQGNPATMTYNGVTYYYHIDGHGNVTAMTDASGNTVAQYNYDAWGKILSQSGSMAAINPFRYAGYRYDEATGLYYLMARYYDPGVGRFISRDTFHGFEINPQSLNLYAYCANNPVMYIDPSGNYYISLTNMGKILLYVLGFNPIGATIVAIGLYKLKVLITAKMGLLGAKLGSFWGPVAAGALSFVFSASGLVVGGEIANALWDCYWQGKKGIEFGVKRNRWGYVYGLDIYAK